MDLSSVQRIKVELGHILHTLKWFLQLPIDAPGLDAIDRMAGANVLGKLGETRTAPQAWRNENRWCLPARLDLDEG